MYSYAVVVVDAYGVEDVRSTHDRLEDALRRVRELVREAMDSEDIDSVFGVLLR